MRPLEDVLQVGGQLQKGHLCRRRGVVPGEVVDVVDVVAQREGLVGREGRRGRRREVRKALY